MIKVFLITIGFVLSSCGEDPKKLTCNTTPKSPQCDIVYHGTTQ